MAMSTVGQPCKILFILSFHDTAGNTIFLASDKYYAGGTECPVVKQVTKEHIKLEEVELYNSPGDKYKYILDVIFVIQT